MIELYCKGRHRSKRLCPSCEELAAYVAERTEKCPFGNAKPFCSSCHIHCYRPDMRDKIRTVMRYSGPRMLLYRPVLVLGHCAVMTRQKVTRKLFKKIFSRLDL